jgi:hypothetical protein
VKRVTALCDERQTAERVVQAWIDLPVTPEDISVLVVRRGELEDGEVRRRHYVPEGMAIGGALGAVAGVGLVAIGWLPGVFVFGPALAALQGLAGGAAAGTIAGAYGGLGWWKTEADIPKELLETADGIVVGAPISPERAELAERAARDAGARGVFVS